MRTVSLFFSCALLLLSCAKETPVKPAPAPSAPLYFPPATGTEWQTASTASLGWNEAELASLYAYLEGKGTRGFIILKDGKIAGERYFHGFTANDMWYWASAGKTLTAMLVGIAQAEGKLQISDRSSKYLGAGWTSLPMARENAITIKHQITMTTGLDDGVPESDCTTPGCLQYKADPGTRWAYHNAPYTLLEKVVESATGTAYNTYTAQKVKSLTGMNGSWIRNGNNNVYFSNTRSAARFGLLLLNKGIWNKTAVLADAAYCTALMQSAQNLNPSYGYLTWLNGKSSYMLPSTQASFAGMLIPEAPADLFAALGKHDQKIYVVPSQQLVVVRFGEDPGNSRLALSSFDNELWAGLKKVIGY